jgi:nucleoside-diphosphate-sugar epimerase
MISVSPSVVYFGIHENLELSREGVWLSNGEEITHEATVRAFFRCLEPSPEGGWRIRIGSEEKEVRLEDTPSFVQRLTGDPRQGYRIHLLHDPDPRGEALDPKTLEFQPGRLVCRTRRGWKARFLRATYHEILKDLERDHQGYFLMLEGARVDLSSARP